MKKLLTIVMAAILLMAAAPLSVFAAKGETQSLDGNFSIVVAEKPSETDSYAAQTLKRYVEQITGNSPKLITDKAAVSGFEIAVGATNRLSADFTGKLDGSYRIKSYGGGVAIVGTGTRGTIYGVYAFLEKFCDCRWFTSTLYVIPEAESIEVPVEVDIAYDTFFESTETDWLSPRDPEYSLANGLSGGVYRKLSDEQGGTVGYINSFCHTLTTVYCKSDDYFGDHPEYFALHGGKRVPEQLCLTNEDTYNIVLAEVMAAIEENHNPDASLQILSLTQHDNQLYCECDSCKALDKENGAHSGTMISFVNKIAKEVAAAGYSNIAIDTFAYQYTRKAPTAVVPEENVIVRLCTIECCFSHALNDPECEANTELMSDLAAWNKICDRLYVWDYATNYAQTLGLFPDFGVLQENVQVFYENGVKGVYEEGNYYMASCDTEFGELRAYLLSRLMQNPYLDYDAEMRAFCEAYYGTGGENIYKFINLITENAPSRHLYIYVGMDATLSLSEEQIAECDALWSQAIEGCTDETHKANLKRSELSWRYWKGCNRVSEFKGLASIEANKQLLTDLKDSGVKQYSESRGFEIATIHPFISPAEWTTDSVPYVFKSVGYILSIVLFAAAGALSAALFVMGILKKKWLYLVHLPLLAAVTEVALWHRRAFLAWRDLDEYALTVVIFCLFFAFVMFALEKLTVGKLGAKKAILSCLKGVIMFIVPYEATILIINNAMYGGRANDAALGMAYMFVSIELFAIILRTLVVFKKCKMGAEKL